MPPPFADPAHARSGGTVTCPSGSTAVGGGALITGEGLGESLHGSVPAGRLAWTVSVDNVSSTADTFVVLAVCADQVERYAQVAVHGENPAGARTRLVARCPAGTVVLGGGGTGLSTSTAQNLGSSRPVGTTGWRVEVNNASSLSSLATVNLVCGRAPAGYTTVTGPAAASDPRTQGSASATCPRGTTPISGGAGSRSRSTSVNLNSSVPSGPDWQGFVNNSSAGATTVTAYAVCARATR